ncbi:hypothetical protein QTP88_002375 [Uroleucon formosanum]
MDVVRARKRANTSHKSEKCTADDIRENAKPQLRVEMNGGPSRSHFPVRAFSHFSAPAARGKRENAVAYPRRLTEQGLVQLIGNERRLASTRADESAAAPLPPYPPPYTATATSRRALDFICRRIISPHSNRSACRTLRARQIARIPVRFRRAIMLCTLYTNRFGIRRADANECVADEKQHPKWSKELDTLNNVHNKMNEMVIKKNGLTLLPTKRSSTVLLDLPKSHKRHKSKD